MKVNRTEFKKIKDQLERHEQTILQLMEIIGKTNQKVKELQKEKSRSIYVK